ncbi:collectin-12-like isoform X2 [Ostrea edulis]|uniref:collectin-12-like isoform X1 n=1 Tax=Ostrea edulis TaxID=37623 RepID=UPI0024AFFA89|nr:collectin-12-like isoform X1 [Ostrea edulis]XP_056015778.1 collectin-12-like isoform X1 [Ostrea edulis]XP_056015782.1 collectin-12-like isoform X2 [Ostrea edulis]
MDHSLEWWYIMLCLSLPVTCEYNHVLFSQSNSNEGLNSSQTLLSPGSFSLPQCAALCTEQPCCLGYLYNRDSRQCILQLRMSPRGDHSSSTVFLPDDHGLRRFRKASGCAASWIKYQDHCYYLGEKKVNWTDAKRECEERCSHLVEIGDQEESDWLASTFLFKNTCPISLFDDCTAWTGGSDVDIEGQYRWSYSNVPITFTAWNEGEPSVGLPTEAEEKDCLELFRNGKWNDRYCFYLDTFICEISLE